MDNTLHHELMENRDDVEQVIDQSDLTAYSGRLAEVCRLAAEFGAKAQEDGASDEVVQEYHRLMKEGHTLGVKIARITARYSTQEEEVVE